MDISSKIRALGWYVGVAALAASLGASPGFALNGEYHPNSFIGFVGTASFQFDSPTSGSVTMPGLGTLPIKRYDVIANGVASGPAAGAPTPGWWWDPRENGRGFYIEVQGDNLLFLGMMYDDL